MLVRQGLSGLFTLIGGGGTLFVLLSGNKELKDPDYWGISSISPLTITKAPVVREPEVVEEEISVVEEEPEKIIEEPQPIVSEVKKPEPTVQQPIEIGYGGNGGGISGDIFRISEIPSDSLPVCGSPIWFGKKGDPSHIPNPNFLAQNDKGKDYKSWARCIYLHINNNIPRHKRVLVVFG